MSSSCVALALVPGEAIQIPVVQMAKKKPGPKPTEGVGRIETVAIRSTPAWKAWLERLAEHDSKIRRQNPNVSDTADRAFVAYAREIGFLEVAPLR